MVHNGGRSGSIAIASMHPDGSLRAFHHRWGAPIDSMVHKLRLAEPRRLSTKILRVRHMQVLMRLAAIRDPLLPAGQVTTFVRVYFRIAICATQGHVLGQSRRCLLLRNNRKNKGYSSYWPT